MTVTRLPQTQTRFEQGIRFARKTGNENITSQTFVDVADLSFALEAGKTYSFMFFIAYQTGAGTEGADFSINGPSQTGLVFCQRYHTSATALTSRTTSTYDSSANVTSGPGTGGAMAEVFGGLTATAAGTLSLRAKAESVAGADVTVLGQSWGILIEH